MPQQQVRARIKNQMTNQIKITYNNNIKTDIDFYNGRPVYCRIIITDIAGDKYSSEIHMPKSWTMKIFSRMIIDSFKLCDAHPKSVYIAELKLDDAKLN